MQSTERSFTVRVSPSRQKSLTGLSSINPIKPTRSTDHPCTTRKAGVAALTLKRCLDISLAIVGFVVSAPLWICIALLIKLEDGGTIFYCQERVGQGGRRFICRKFRTMLDHAENADDLLPVHERDVRVTGIGRLLRATAMDELPQLWNILVGEMSFVGPRALMPEEIEWSEEGGLVPLEKIQGYEARHRVRPGLTGIAQAYAPRDLPRRHKFKFDLLYIKKQTFWLDIKLIGLSIWLCCLGKCEYRGWKCRRPKAGIRKNRKFNLSPRLIHPPSKAA